MKAVVYTCYGAPDVLHLKDVEKPTPKKNELLIKVHATTVTSGDVIMRSLNVPGPQWQRMFARLYLGVFRPKRPILGMELAGEVEAVGSHVTRFQKESLVFASTFASNFGGYAEYKCLPESGLVATKPANLTFEEAAGVPGGGMTALGIVQKAKLKSGQSVLIYGASGSVGTFAVQLAKHSGAHVTGVCSAANLELVKSLGADQVIDYTRDDFTQNGPRYDVIIDAVGKLDPSHGKQALKAGGHYFNVLTTSLKPSTEALVQLKDLIEAGQIRPVIDRCYSLAQIVEAHRYVETGRKRGSVVVMVKGS